MSFARSVVFVVALASPLSPFASRLNADAAQHAGHAPGSQSALVEAVRHATESFDPPVLEGHLLHFVDGPNRFGLPARYELRVWARQTRTVRLRIGIRGSLVKGGDVAASQSGSELHAAVDRGRWTSHESVLRRIVAESLCDVLDLRATEKVLDVAGDAAFSLVAARRGCDVASASAEALPLVDGGL